MSAEPEDLPPGQDLRHVGLVAKYHVMRIEDDGHTLTPVSEKVFVMKPGTDPLAREALRLYSRLARGDGRTMLGDDIDDWLDSIEHARDRERRLRELQDLRAEIHAPRPNRNGETS